MDGASLLAVEMLFKSKDKNDNNNDVLRILDLCSAPGGKTLVILQHLFQKFISSSNEGYKSVELTCNEPNFERRKRLRKVLDDYIPKAFLTADDTADSFIKVNVTGHDATDARVFSDESFDLILIDAPCSSDRHHIQQGTPLPSPTASAPLVKIQQTMLLNGIRWLKSGSSSRLVYATCSLNPAENDHVIDNAISHLSSEKGEKKILTPFQVVRPKLASSCNPEKTKWGYLILPMSSSSNNNRGSIEQSFGPLYFASLVKK